MVVMFEILVLGMKLEFLKRRAHPGVYLYVLSERSGEESKSEDRRGKGGREEDRLKSCIPIQCNSDQLSPVPNQLIYKKDRNLVD
jgi:hypothetical protein